MPESLSAVCEVRTLKELRQLTRQSQSDLADVLGIRQPSIHKIENQSDILFSTLHRYVEGLGGTLELQVRLPGVGEIEFRPHLSQRGGERENQYASACEFVFKTGRASTGEIQRQMGVGYNTAARWIERMVEDGYVGPANHVGRREIYRDKDGNPR